jgi:membrane associated rhomboid family serine protease
MIPLRDENPTHIIPWVTYALIGASILVFFWQLGLGQESAERMALSLGFVPASFFGKAALPPALDMVPAPLTLVTSVFLHGSILHVAGNMLYLWIFGNNVEEAVGHFRYLAFYLLCGAAAALGQGFVNPDSTIPMVGASGAISGVLGAYLLLYPTARILVVIPLGLFLYPARLSTVWVLGLWFAMQLLAALITDPSQPGIAFWAHFFGFLAGALLILVMRRPGFALFGSPRVLPKGPWARALLERDQSPDEPRSFL